jgi:pyruvate/2-oxoglutarate dehydrogenase complex dihydrolipoamide acyltransferase (E2) component
MASVKMPQLGESITEGTISKWLKQPGDQVKKYEGLVEVITDKVNAEVPAPLAGILKEIKVKEGTTVTVGTEIAVIEESVGAAAPTLPSPRGGGEVRGATPAAELKQIPSPLAGERQGGGSSEGRARLSPAVRALIEEHRISDVELSGITGSGIAGRISKKDIEDFVAKRAQPATANGEQRQTSEAPAATPTATPGTTIPLSPMRRAIATNMAKSKQTIPHAWTVAEVDMTNVVRFRQKAKDSFKLREGIDLTFVPIIVKAVVEGLKAVPVLNASWSDLRAGQGDRRPGEACTSWKTRDPGRPGWHLHRQQSGDLRNHPVLLDHRAAAGRHPRHGRHRQAAGRPRGRRDRRPLDDESLLELRPPGAGRRVRRPLPAGRPPLAGGLFGAGPALLTPNSTDLWDT